MSEQALAEQSSGLEKQKNVYLETILLIERLHRRFLDVIKAELDRQRIQDINNVQTLILYNIGDSELTIGELTNRGYYLGSKVSYNVKNLVENGYLIQQRSPHDKRSSTVRLSEKGSQICENIDALYRKHLESLANHKLDSAALTELNATLHQLEGFWSSAILSAFRAS